VKITWNALKVGRFPPTFYPQIAQIGADYCTTPIRCVGASTLGGRYLEIGVIGVIGGSK
jgi:hypothetical protein